MAERTLPLTGAYLEPHATAQGERRYVKNTTGDVHIDPQTGAVDIEIIVDSDLRGLETAFLVDENGEFTGVDEYDSFEIEFYEHADVDGDPVVRYYANHVEIDVEITFPIVGECARAYLTATPRGSSGFERFADAAPESIAEPEAEQH